MIEPFILKVTNGMLEYHKNVTIFYALTLALADDLDDYLSGIKRKQKIWSTFQAATEQLLINIEDLVDAELCSQLSIHLHRELPKIRINRIKVIINLIDDLAKNGDIVFKHQLSSYAKVVSMLTNVVGIVDVKINQYIKYE